MEQLQLTFKGRQHSGFQNNSLNKLFRTKQFDKQNSKIIKPIKLIKRFFLTGLDDAINTALLCWQMVKDDCPLHMTKSLLVVGQFMSSIQPSKCLINDFK